MLYVAVAAFAGGCLSALLGWLDSREPFNPRKFARSIGAALISGIGFALAYQSGETVTLRDILIAILGGSGVDVLSNRALGALVR